MVFVGCSGDSVSHTVTPEPSAAVRWVNVVPDTMPLDYRVVDVVTNANEASVAYRGSSGAYRRVPPGSHRVRVFLAGTTFAGNSDAVVSTVVLDTTLTFAVNHYYTVFHTGYMKSGASPKHHFVVTDDAFPTVASANNAFRAFNGMPAGAVDVAVVQGTATGGAAPAATFGGIAYGAISNYAQLAAAPTSPSASTYRITAAASSSTVALADALAPVGTPASPATTTALGVTTPALDAIAGAQQAGSIFTFVATPPAVSYTLTASGTTSGVAAGTKSTVAGTTTNAIVTLIDKNPGAKLLGQ
jgi:hypothetical protein